MEHLIELRMPDEIGLSEGTYMGAASDPDAQATVSDFIDYTEYLPADLQRSLTLIRELDERYLRATQAVHELTKTYGALPSLPDADKPDPVDLRRRISEQLERAISARECAFAEARRLYDVVDRHFDRLGSIQTKLENMSKSSPALHSVATAAAAATAATAATTTAPGEPSEKKATRTTRSTAGPTTPTRLTLRLDPRKNIQNREAIDPSSPNAESPKPGLPDIGKRPLALRLKVPPTTHNKGRKGRELSNASTNEEINAFETSTRNALQMLKPPPDDAPIGSEHLPWLRLTEWELTRLRKRMKKNNVWQPSEVMVHRELAVRGRGWDNYQRARAHAQETGTDLIDCDDIEHNYKPGQSIQGRDIHAGQETTLTNRGMKLNEAKKLKRENLAREAAAAAAAAAAGETDGKARSPQLTRVMSRSSRSRTNKNDQTNDDGVDAVDKNIRSRQASSVATWHTAAADFSSNASQANENLSKDRESRQTRKRKPADLELALDHDSEITSNTRASRKKSKSGEGTETISAPTDQRTTRQQQQSRAQSPEKSSGAQKAATTTGGRRNKRPAPGPVTSSQDGGTAVSVGRRKTKPAAARQMKRDSLAKETPQQAMILEQEDMRIDEDGVHEQVDPNEPRYCICGDVSFGTMICCEDDNCDKEWFHLECVGLTEVPSRTAKWYCPECRTNIARATADGIVRNGNRR